LNKTQKGAGAATESGLKKKAPLFAVILFLVLVAGVLSVLFVEKALPPARQSDPDCSESGMYLTERNIKLFEKSKYVYDIEFAKTASQQELGLSYRDCIPKYAAMIFLFPLDDKFGIWMKNMAFAIDVIWLDKDKKVVTIEEDMQPSSYPKIYYPTADIRYVIEMAPGSVDSMGVAVGDTMNW
jgi:uncharacterized membrane protein (UPF0127 family)